MFNYKLIKQFNRIKTNNNNIHSCPIYFIFEKEIENHIFVILVYKDYKNGISTLNKEMNFQQKYVSISV